MRDEFARNFAERGEVGAAVCIVVDGVTAVDLAGGWADPAARRAWQLRHAVELLLRRKGVRRVAGPAAGLTPAWIALDDPIAAVWPKFAAAGKGDATLRHALCHRAGCRPPPPLTNDDLWGLGPYRRPGRHRSLVGARDRHAYHTNTYGHLIGEVVRRVSGDPCGRRLAALVFALGAELYVSVPPAEQQRCATVLFEALGARDNALGRAPSMWIPAWRC